MLQQLDAIARTGSEEKIGTQGLLEHLLQTLGAAAGAAGMHDKNELVSFILKPDTAHGQDLMEETEHLSAKQKASELWTALREFCRLYLLDLQYELCRLT